MMQQVQKVKNIAKKLASHPAAPFVSLLAVLLLWHLRFTLVGGDEITYRNRVAELGLWGFTVESYRTWSSRTLVELLLCIVVQLPEMVWRLVNPVMVALSAWCTSRIVCAEKNPQANWMICGFFVMYPWLVMRSAGWITTTLVYVWPAAACLLALVPTARLAQGEKPGKRWCILSLPLLLYGCNVEPLAVLCGILLAVFAAYLLFAKEKLHWLLPAQLAMCLANILNAAFCPGARQRFAAEATQWFPNYGMRSFWQNAELGVSTALDAVFYNRDMVFFLFCVLLAWAVWHRQKNIVYRLLGLFPVGVCVVFGTFRHALEPRFPALMFFNDALNGEGIITFSTANIPAAYLPFLLLCAAFVACVVDLYLALGHTPAALAAMTAFVSGMLSRAMLGFSPTAGVSGDRTGYFFSLCMIAAAGLLYQGLSGAKRWQKIVFGAVLLGYCLLQIGALVE